MKGDPQYRSGQSPLIAHVLFRFDVGGLENGVVNLINRIPEHSFRHVIIALSDYTDFRQRLNRPIPVYALNKREGKDFGLHWRLYKLFRELKPDIVHTRNLNAVEAQFPAWLAGVKGRVHGEHGWDVHDLDGSSRKYRLWRKAFAPFVHRYIALSQHLANYLTRDVGISTSRVECICNGVDTNWFQPLGDDLAARFRTEIDGVDKIVIGTLGRMEEVKDQKNLARAFVSLLTRRPDLKEKLVLVLVGEGSKRKEIERFLIDKQVESSVRLPGQRDDTADVLRSFDVFVLPSLAEGISNTILEAMATGLPVVATDVGGNAELVDEGRSGVLVPSADPDSLAAALERYVDDRAMRRRHGNVGRSRAESLFSLEHMVQRYVQVYGSVLEPALRHRAYGSSER